MAKSQLLELKSFLEDEQREHWKGVGRIRWVRDLTVIGWRISWSSLGRRFGSIWMRRRRCWGRTV